MRIPGLKSKTGVRCDHCRRRFDPQLREEAGASGGVVGVFDCPHCATRYESYTIDGQGLRIREALRDVASGSPRAVSLLRQMRSHTRPGRGRLSGLTEKNPRP